MNPDGCLPLVESPEDLPDFMTDPEKAREAEIQFLWNSLDRKLRAKNHALFEGFDEFDGRGA